MTLGEIILAAIAVYFSAGTIFGTYIFAVTDGGWRSMPVCYSTAFSVPVIAIVIVALEAKGRLSAPNH